MREGARPGLWARLLSWLRGILGGRRDRVPAAPVDDRRPRAQGPPPDWPGLPQGPPEHWLERLREGGSPPMRGGGAPGGGEPRPAPAASDPEDRGSRPDEPPPVRRFPWRRWPRRERPALAATARPTAAAESPDASPTPHFAGGPPPRAAAPPASAGERRRESEPAAEALSPQALPTGQRRGPQRPPAEPSARSAAAPGPRPRHHRELVAGAPRERSDPFRPRRVESAERRAPEPSPGLAAGAPPADRVSPFRRRRPPTAEPPTAEPPTGRLATAPEAAGSPLVAARPSPARRARWLSLRSLWARLVGRRHAAPTGPSGRVIAFEPPRGSSDDAPGPRRPTRRPQDARLDAPGLAAGDRQAPRGSATEPPAPPRNVAPSHWPSTEPAARRRRGYDADVWGALPQAGADQRRRRRGGRDDAIQATDALAAMWPELPPHDDPGPPTGREIAAEETRKRWLEREQRGEQWNAWPF